MPMSGNHIPVSVGAHAALTCGATVDKLTPPSAECDALVISVETQSVRLTVTPQSGAGATDPTSSLGHLYGDGEGDVLPVGPGQEVRVLRQAAGAIVQYQWAKLARVA